MSRKVEIYDTTLRDGSQLEGISLTVDDKLRRWHSRDGRSGRRPNADDSRWTEGSQIEPLARAARDAAAVAAAAAAGAWADDRVIGTCSSTEKGPAAARILLGPTAHVTTCGSWACRWTTCGALGAPLMGAVVSVPIRMIITGGSCGAVVLRGRCLLL